MMFETPGMCVSTSRGAESSAASSAISLAIKLRAGLRDASLNNICIDAIESERTSTDTL